MVAGGALERCGNRPKPPGGLTRRAGLLAWHGNASMECYRRAMLNEQTFEGRQENLNQANKLSRTYATLVESLNRHRGKGQQKVTVEHVHVHAGGQAVVGSVERSKESDRPQLGDASHAKQIALTPESPLWRTDTERERVPSPSNAERPVPDARRKIARRSKGNKNAFKHGRYSAEAIARRREIAALLRKMRALAREVV